MIWFLVVGWNIESVNLPDKMVKLWIFTIGLTSSGCQPHTSSVWPWSGTPKVCLYYTFLGGLRHRHHGGQTHRCLLPKKLATAAAPPAYQWHTNLKMFTCPDDLDYFNLPTVFPPLGVCTTVSVRTTVSTICWWFPMQNSCVGVQV